MPRKFLSRLSRIFDTQPSGKEKQANLEKGLSNYIDSKLNTGNIKLADKDIKFGKKSFEDIQYSNNEETTVCVVGAGFAGLAAAYELTQQKFKVTVLEARDRVGGRVWTQKTIGRGRFIEAGAELIGTTHYQWIYYARLFGLGLSVMTTEDNYAAEKLDFVCIINNEEIKDKELEELNDLSNQVFKRISKDAEAIAPYEPWRSKDAEKLDAISVKEKLTDICKEICQDKPDLLKKLLISLEFHFVNDQATPIDEQSYLGLLAAVQGSNSYKDNINLDNGHESEDKRNVNYWDGSETFRCANGNQSLADEFRERIQKEGGEIRLECEVTKIDIDKDETQNQITQKKVTITTSGGKSEKYDYVVFAVPPGVWESIEINPSILELMKIKPGLAVKRFTPFKERYWLAENKSPAAISDELGMVWESTDNQMATPDSEFVLTVFAGGVYVEKVKNEENFRKSIKQLFPKTFEGFEGKSELVDWGAEKYTKGGYTCPRVNKIKTTQLLNLPYYGRMFFAGEHTNTAFSGYMEGALRSGVFAAKRIAEAQLCRRSEAIGNDKGIYRGETPSRFEGNLIASVDPNKSQPSKIQLFDGLIKVLDGVDSIKKIVIRYGDIIDGIEIYYTNTETPDIQFGSTQKCRKNNFEWIVKDNNHLDGVRLKQGTWFNGIHIVQLQLKTKTEGWLSICGSGNYCQNIDPEFTTFVANEDEELISFYGASVPVDYPKAQQEIYPVISYLGAIFRKRKKDLK